MIVCVTGGRDYTDKEALWSRLDELNASDPIHWIVHGGARGADQLAGEWAEEHGLASRVFRVTREEKRLYGTRAGISRNKRMVNYLSKLKNPVLLVCSGKRSKDIQHRAGRNPAIRILS